jgi:hypothetical protein
VEVWDALPERVTVKVSPRRRSCLRSCRRAGA